VATQTRKKLVVKDNVLTKPKAVKRPVSAKPRAKKKQKRGIAVQIKITAVICFLILLSPFYSRFVINGFVSGWHWLNDIGEDANYRHYKSFNIHVAEKYSIHGIDVSFAQGKIDWQQVKAMDENGLHISFAFIKATEGENFTDSFFQRNWREAAKTGIICGAYHYFRPQKSGRLQALQFLKTVKLEKNDLPPVVDVEKLDNVTPQQMRTALNDYFTTIQHKLHVKPVIYSGLSFYTDYLKTYFGDYPVWIAHYDKPEQAVNRAADWLFWQHSEKATVNGIHHAVDFDTFKGDTVSFNKLLRH
jgi:lysozyme